MPVESYILLLFIAALVLFVVVRLRYRLRCPSCKGPARRTKIEIGFLVSQGKKKTVRTAAGACLDCGHMWTLRNTRSRLPGLITVYKGTELRR